MTFLKKYGWFGLAVVLIIVGYVFVKSPSSAGQFGSNYFVAGDFASGAKEKRRLFMSDKRKNTKKQKESKNMDEKLFPIDLPSLEWKEFVAAGFEQSVNGVIYRTDSPPCCGVPLGGISTGCLDIDSSGVTGFCTIFNSFVPRQKPRYQPLLGLAVEGKPWLLTTQKIVNGGTLQAYTEPRANEEEWQVEIPKIEGVKCAKEIHYWGHYPVADLEYELDAPVSVGLRAWAPFIPGDIAASNIPGAIFELHLRSTSDAPQNGTIAFNFPGPTEKEVDTKKIKRQEIKEEKFRGVSVTMEQVSYALGVIGEEKPRLGSSLGANGAAWTEIGTDLPSPQPDERGTSLSVDFSVEKGGAVSFADPDGKPQLTSYGIFPPETYMLGMTFMYEGDKETGVEIVRRSMYNMVIRHRHPWDLTNMIHCDTGERTFGTDYYQNMMLWTVPAAIEGKDIRALYAEDGLVNRVIQAGKEK